MTAMQRMEPGDPRYAQAIEAMARGIYEATKPASMIWEVLPPSRVRARCLTQARAALAALEAEGWSLTDTREEASMDESEDMRQRIENDLQRAFKQTAEIERLREALRQAYADIIAVNCAGCDSTRGSIALAAITRISKSLSSVPVACEHEWMDARNEAVISGEVCLRCGAVRAGNRPSSVPGQEPA